jgi:NADH:ubiquinone oxidoreductase subunit 2 (subunit N)
VAYSRFSVGGLGAAVQPWIDVTALLAALTMLHAGLAALRASTLRQLSAQLAGFQAGLMLLAILSVTRQANAKDGLIALLFTVVATGVAAIALFVTIDVLENTVHARRLEDFRGLGRTAGFLSLMLSLALASLGGLPPLAGFLSRILVIEAAFASGHGVPGVITVAAGVLTALASLRFIALLYSEGGEEARAPAQRTPRTTWTVIAACGLAAVVVTVLAQPLLALAGGGAAAVLPGT